MYADHKHQGITCSFAATCDVMNVRSSSVNTQFGEMCLVFPRLICRDLHAQRALYNSLHILRCLTDYLPEQCPEFGDPTPPRRGPRFAPESPTAFPVCRRCATPYLLVFPNFFSRENRLFLSWTPLLDNGKAPLVSYVRWRWEALSGGL